MNITNYLPKSVWTSSWETKTQKIHSEIQKFKNIAENLNISHQLENLEKSFSQELRLDHPRDVYPIYSCLNSISSEVETKGSSHISQSWQAVLQELNNHQICQVGVGYHSFDTSFASSITQDGLNRVNKTITIEKLDLTQPANLNAMVDYSYKINRIAFKLFFPRNYFKKLLTSPDIDCFVAKNLKGEIVGGLFGTTDKRETDHVFNIFEFSRLPAMSHMGIANRLMDCVVKIQNINSQLKFVTLDVFKDNSDAINFYKKNGFVVDEKPRKGNETFFMIKSLNADTPVLKNKKNARHFDVDFRFDFVGLFKMSIYVVQFYCEEFWRKQWYK